MAILFFFHTHISSLLLLFTALDATQARTLIVGGSKNSIKQWGQNIFSRILELQIPLHQVCQLYTNQKQYNAGTLDYQINEHACLFPAKFVS